jgi:hypothetical protein
LALGSIALTTSSQRASAAVDTTDLTIQNREYAQTSKLQDVGLQVNAQYAFDAAQVPDRWILTLAVGDTQTDQTTVTSTRMAPSDATASGTETLSGSIVDTPEFDISQFRVVDGVTTTETLYVTLRFDVQVGETSIATAEATDTAELTITPGEIDATSSVAGTGEITLGT